jgi:hypothetical protein
MNMKTVRCLVTILITMTLGAAAYAEGMGIGVKVGTLGLGADVTVGLGEQVNARVGVNYLTYDYDGEESDVDYELELDMFSLSALLDWHPGGGLFRFSGGVFYNNNEISGDGTVTETTEIGDIEFSPAQIGTLSATVEFDDFAPYIGLGWGNAASKTGSVGFSCDFGILFQGKPELDLTSDGTLKDNPFFKAELAKEEDEVQDELDWFQYYPVIALGINIWF